ncbi:LOW QUALITY PROTEIN: zinc finger CCCH domain-containing protein 13-like [Mya arenaria]|uniref:LOW QUALITY PROTEIN: zinc finger CCCH domain-containing protein 13-like n=1 Tax=Mya arenaria TaxID=6604 RepID=UPI0022E66AEF|nr:LOW QUALITY PROTEIN: zinc finger CCCH domain-containing protein 13-like [Mya arenaria]
MSTFQGLIHEEDFPVQYRRKLHIRGLTFDELVNSILGFTNPGNVSYLLGVLRQKQEASLMRGLHRLAIPEKEYAESLKKQQSQKWAYACVAEGVAFFKEGRETEAMQKLNKALQIDKTNVEALVARGALYANTESYTRALEDFEEALTLNPKHPNAIKYMHETLLAKGKTHEDEHGYLAAEKCYMRAIEVMPDSQEAKESLRYVLYKQESESARGSKRGRSPPPTYTQEDMDHSLPFKETTDTLKKLIKDEQRSKKRHSYDNESLDENLAKSQMSHHRQSLSSSSSSSSRSRSRSKSNRRKTSRSRSPNRDNTSRGQRTRSETPKYDKRAEFDMKKGRMSGFERSPLRNKSPDIQKPRAFKKSSEKHEFDPKKGYDADRERYKYRGREEVEEEYKRVEERYRERKDLRDSRRESYDKYERKQGYRDSPEHGSGVKIDRLQINQDRSVSVTPTKDEVSDRLGLEDISPEEHDSRYDDYHMRAYGGKKEDHRREYEKKDYDRNNDIGRHNGKRGRQWDIQERSAKSVRAYKRESYDRRKYGESFDESGHASESSRNDQDGPGNQERRIISVVKKKTEAADKLDNNKRKSGAYFDSDYNQEIRSIMVGKKKPDDRRESLSPRGSGEIDDRGDGKWKRTFSERQARSRSPRHSDKKREEKGQAFERESERSYGRDRDSERSYGRDSSRDVKKIRSYSRSRSPSPRYGKRQEGDRREDSRKEEYQKKSNRADEYEICEKPGKDEKWGYNRSPEQGETRRVIAIKPKGKDSTQTTYKRYEDVGEDLGPKQDIFAPSGKKQEPTQSKFSTYVPRAVKLKHHPEKSQNPEKEPDIDKQDNRQRDSKDGRETQDSRQQEPDSEDIKNDPRFKYRPMTPEHKHKQTRRSSSRGRSFMKSKQGQRKSSRSDSSSSSCSRSSVKGRKRSHSRSRDRHQSSRSHSRDISRRKSDRSSYRHNEPVELPDIKSRWDSPTDDKKSRWEGPELKSNIGKVSKVDTVKEINNYIASHMISSSPPPHRRMKPEEKKALQEKWKELSPSPIVEDEDLTSSLKDLVAKRAAEVAAKLSGSRVEEKHTSPVLRSNQASSSGPGTKGEKNLEKLMKLKGFRSRWDDKGTPYDENKEKFESPSKMRMNKMKRERRYSGKRERSSSPSRSRSRSRRSQSGSRSRSRSRSWDGRSRSRERRSGRGSYRKYSYAYKDSGDRYKHEKGEKKVFWFHKHEMSKGNDPPAVGTFRGRGTFYGRGQFQGRGQFRGQNRFMRGRGGFSEGRGRGSNSIQKTGRGDWKGQGQMQPYNEAPPSKSRWSSDGESEGEAGKQSAKQKESLNELEEFYNKLKTDKKRLSTDGKEDN